MKNKKCNIPFRLDLAGGWLDQPFVSKQHPGSVITISIEPDFVFNDRSGMASSTRAKAIELWETNIPNGNKENLAKILFCVENPPGSKYISGSQDSIGIVYPGINKLYYDKWQYWPKSIDSILDESTLIWLEQHLWFIDLSIRKESYNVLSTIDITEARARDLANASEGVWQAIINKDISSFGKCFRESFEAQVKMFPNMVTLQIKEFISKYEKFVLGYKVSGAGGGGYFVVISDKPIENAVQIRIRRK